MSLGGFILFTATALLVKTTMSASSEGIVKAEVVILDYHDLVERKDLSHEIEKAFGKDGIGLLTVKNVPEMSRLRENLLPLARRFAMLDDAVKEKYVDEKSYYSFGWSHGKENCRVNPIVARAHTMPTRSWTPSPTTLPSSPSTRISPRRISGPRRISLKWRMRLKRWGSVCVTWASS